MRTCGVLLLLLCCVFEANAFLDVGEQSQVTTVLDTASYVLKETNEYYEKVAKAAEEASKATSIASKATEILAKQDEALKLARSIGKVLKGLQAAAAIAGFVFTFFMPSELSVITDLVNKRFDEVNLKLDSISVKLVTMTKEMKASVEFNNFLTSFRTWENDILNTQVKLQDTKKAMAATKDQRQLLNLALDFNRYYERSGVHGKMLNIHRSATITPSPTHTNFFDTFIKEHGCDVGKLMRLFLLLKGLLTNVAEQTLTYYQFKGMPNQVDASFRDAYKYMYEMRNTFNEYVLNCKKETIIHAENDAKNIVTDNAGNSDENVAKLISSKLVATYPWFTWSVALLDDVNEVAIFNGKHIVELETKGQTFLKISDHGEKKKDILLLWQDTDVVPNCHGRERSDTAVFYTCDGCTNDGLVTGDRMLSHDVCSGASFTSIDMLPYIRSYPHVSQSDQNERKKFNNYIARWKWVAASVPKPDACASNVCGNHGTCHQIPYTGRAQCICQQFYEGLHCEEFVILDRQIENLIADLRKTYLVATGVPTTVDIFFQVRDVSKTLDTMLNNIKTYHEFGQALVKHAAILHQASYIANKYSALQHDTIKLTEFGMDLDKFFLTASFDYVSTRLREILLGESFTDTKGSDFVNIYKKYFSADMTTRCTSSYNDNVSSMITNLAALDQAISEAYLEYIQWKRERVTSYEQTVLMAKATRMGSNSVQRQKDYWTYWKASSCPAFYTVDLINRHCSDISSFNDMVVNIQCGNNKRPKYSSVQCMFVNGQLQWDKAPKCEYYWTSWSSWSQCSTNCGGGSQTRTRSCVGHHNSNCDGHAQETRVCGTESCCQSKYGKYKCAYGPCINKEWLCDGDNDCGDGEDETRQMCPDHIFPGDRIGLKNIGHTNQWLSCYCTVNCGIDECRLRSCPGTDMDGTDWDNCQAETFQITADGRGNNQPIRSGDSVAIKYARDSSRPDYGTWLSCWGTGSDCTTRACSGGTLDFSKCRGETFWIYGLKGNGKPIKVKDTIYIKYSSDGAVGHWLSGSSGDDGVKTRTCPGTTVNSATINKCTWEAWVLYRG